MWYAAGSVRGLLVQGEEARLFLEGLLTNSLAELTPGRAQLSLVCNNKGQILHPLVALQPREEGYLLLGLPAQMDALAAYLEHFLVREAVELGLCALECWELRGSGLLAAARALGVVPHAGLQAFAGHPLIWGHWQLGDVERGWVLASAEAGASWRQRLIDARLTEEPSAAGRQLDVTAYERLRIAEGWPAWQVDYPSLALPAESGLTCCLDLGKGCYVGQESHARLHYRGRSQTLLKRLELPAASSHIPGPAIAPGQALYQDGTVVGEVTSAAPPYAIALLRARLFDPQRPLLLSAEGAPGLAVRDLCTNATAQPDSV